LTTDKALFPASCLARRTRKLSLDELVVGALLRYPIYWDHELKGVTTCMAVLLRIQAQRDALQAQGRLHQLKHGFWRRILRKLKNWLAISSSARKVAFAQIKL
jgi:capsular polysaccharide export protein